VVDTCVCFLPLVPPATGEWWQPIEDDEPDRKVRAVIRYGEDPSLRRAIRRSDGAGWAEHGHLVNYYHDLTPPMPWERTGMCWAEVSHPVVACEP
jgi:hypothetical protein